MAQLLADPVLAARSPFLLPSARQSYFTFALPLLCRYWLFKDLILFSLRYFVYVKQGMHYM